MTAFLFFIYIIAAFAGGWKLGRSFEWVQDLQVTTSYIVTFFIADLSAIVCFFILMGITQAFQNTNSGGVGK